MASRSNKPVDLPAPIKLIETAQRLFGLHGLEGISLRQISKAAGSGNNYAVQYHFGSLSGLIRAIQERNLPELDRIRTRMLAEAEEQGRMGDIRTLIDILYRPLVDHVDSEGERVHARFALAMFRSPQGLSLMGDTRHLMPVSQRVLDLLYLTIPHIPPALVRERLRLLSISFLASIFNRNPPFEGAELDEALVDNALAMTTAALLAPVPERLRDMLGQAAPRTQ